MLAPSPVGSPLLVRVVLSPGVREQAQAIVDRAGARELAVVRAAGEHERFDERRRLQTRLQLDAPAGANIDTEPVVGRTVCPRVEIELDVDESSDEAKRWASEMMARHGHLRVVITRLDGELLNKDDG